MILSTASLFALGAISSFAPVPRAAQESERAREIFVTNCATCHGERGDGQGTTQLDRPARSFMDGGFSFGNTPEQLFKTISTGIPGTPMPAFDSSLSQEERELLASYVVTLGPPVEEVKEEDMILAVHDRPLIVRGHLPPLAEGLPHQPRGLLIGDPSGITFEYRVDDVRLLALRQGGFVKRTDWTGRGGTALEPLGKVVHFEGGGRPGPLFSLADGAIPLSARMSGTRLDGDHAQVEYHLTLGSHEITHVAESPLVITTPGGTGFTRAFQLTNGRRRVHLALRDPTQAPGARPIESDITFDFAFVTTQESDGVTSLQMISVVSKRWSRREGVLIVDLEPGELASVEIGTVPSFERPSRR